MAGDRFQRVIEGLLSPAGITINGGNPWDIRVMDERFYQRVVREGSLGCGEAYTDGWWDCDRLDEFFARIMPTRPEAKVNKKQSLVRSALSSAVLNPYRKSKAFQVGERHYDIGNDLFRNMLDKRMVYSCAYWKDAETLDKAQEAKLDLICRKLDLRPGDRILDIGCGWGGFAKYAAEHYRVEVVGITVSKEQALLGSEWCRGLPVEIRLQDYRDMDGKYDHIVSVGMFEHVGFRNYRTFMKKVHQCLNDTGLFLLHTIGDEASQGRLDPWMEKYIFPNSFIPAMKQIAASAEGLFVLEDVHNIGFHYDATLTSWYKNFDSNWDKLRERYDQKFYRMWKYYLLSSAGTFRARCLQVWQFVFSKKGAPGGYDPSVRNCYPSDPL
jgi:cyclopropane-fatty-acyl-phospholipid synthase